MQKSAPQGTWPYQDRRVARTDDWQAIRFFNLYRFTLGGMLLLLPAIFEGILFPNLYPRAFSTVALSYIFLVVLSIFLVALRKFSPTLQLFFQVITDIAVVVLLTYFGGGIQSNLGLLLLVTLALAGMMARERMTLLFAALASIGILLGHAYDILTHEAAGGLFFQAGILSTAYFAVAWLAHTLSRYARSSERLAIARGVDLENMAEANRLVIQDMPDGVLVVDERGLVRQFNPSAERLIGCSMVANESVLEDCSPLLDTIFSAWRQNSALGREVLHLPETNHATRVRFLPVQRRGFWGAVIVLEDMSRLQTQAQQLKLAALGRLTASIAHEVRNPLSSISYATELLKEQDTGATNKRLLQIILDNTLRLDRIVQDVMQVNQRDRVHGEYLDLALFLTELVDNLCSVERLSPDGLELKITIIRKIYFDRGHLEQVVWNLCRNALRYSSQRINSVRLHVFLSATGRVVLDVEDDGEGVPIEKQAKLFEPFFTTESQGTGLGLYIARELCDANGAEIMYQQSDLGGACFRVIFGGEHEV